MNEILVQVCVESVYIIEFFTAFLSCMILLEYRGKHKAAGLILQVATMRLLQKNALACSLWLTGAAELSVLFNTLGFALIVFGCYKGKPVRKIAAASVYYLPAILADYITLVLILRIARMGKVVEATRVAVLENEMYNSMAVILCGQILMVLMTAYLFVWLVIEKKSLIREFGMLVCLSVYQAVVLYVYYSFCGSPQMGEVMIGGLIYVFGVVIDFSSIYMISGSLKKLETEKELSALYQKRQEELAYYKEMNDHVDRIRVMRHEFANQLQVVYGLLEEKDTEKGKKLLGEVYASMRVNIGGTDE